MCDHKQTKVVEVQNSIHKLKTICADCDKFIKWSSTKTVEQRAQDKKKYVAEYYRNLENYPF
jgi:thymidine kinase